MTPLVTADDHAVAAAVAAEAGRLLLDVRAAHTGDAASLKDDGDLRSHEHIMSALARLRPDDAVLSEEGVADPARLEVPRVWIVDPLDGTREFSEPDRSDWAVHVALVVGGEAVVGAVALPALGVTLGTWPAPPGPPPLAGRVRVLVSRTRPPATALAIATALDAELVPMGSAGAKAMAVVRGEADVYAHSGGQYEWDSAAPVAVSRAAGLHVSRLDGSPLIYNQRDPYLPDVLICRRELAAAVIAAAGSEMGT